MYRGECNITHGGSKTRLYRIWKQMRVRCTCSTNPTYRYYGARGISICDEWNDFAVFREWAISHGYTGELSIDRVDNDGDYCPDNCRWIPMREQFKNTRKCKYYEHSGERLLHKEWAQRLGIHPSSLTERIQKYGLDYALTAQQKNARYIHPPIHPPMGG